MVTASIITIGDELLIGQTIDTNSAEIARMLNQIGVWVQRRVAVGDQREAIWAALTEEETVSDIVLITGGLGPTADDITKPLLCEYFGGQMVVNEAVLANVKYIFEVLYKRPLLERNLKQAEVPNNCRVLLNKRGTAPGMWFERNGKVIVSMPGVPHEMRGMMENDVIPSLPGFFNLKKIGHRTLVTAGAGESLIAERLVDFENQLPATIKLAYLPNYGIVRLRLSAILETDDEEKALDHSFAELKEKLSDIMIADSDTDLAAIVADLLKQGRKTIGLAESCTGGYLAHLLTAMPGSSVYFKGGIVSYANELKENLLGVKATTLLQHGAVSEETVREMAKGALQQLDTDYIIAVSGIMGPDGGTIQKPVGTVWVAVGDRTALITQRFYFRHNRAKNIELTAQNALNLVRIFILNNNKDAMNRIKIS